MLGVRACDSGEDQFAADSESDDRGAIDTLKKIGASPSKRWR
jgi:hypothetical protein